MTALDKYETSRTSCHCGQGEYIFFSVEHDGYTYMKDKSQWYEMGISCSDCANLYAEFKKTRMGKNEVVRISILESDKAPMLD